MRRRSGDYDVVFYMPSVAPRLLGGGAAGGAETQISLIARTLARRGVRVAVVLEERAASGSCTRVDDVDIVFGASAWARTPLLGKLLTVASALAAFRRARSPFVVTRIAGAEVGLVGICAKLLGRSLVHSSANDFDFDVAPRGLSGRNLALYRLGVRVAKTIVVQTRTQEALCRDRFGRSAVVVPSIAEAARRGPGGEAFLWAGRLVDYKQPLEYVALARALPHARFRLVGMATPSTGVIERQIRRASHSLPNLEVIGCLPRRELLDLVDRSVAVVSTSTHEGVSNVFLEGWARGIPALSLSHDPDGVIEGSRLGIVAHGSFETLVTGADELWRTRNDRDAVAERCMAFVRETHDAEAVADAWCRVLEIEKRRVCSAIDAASPSC